MKKLFLTAMFAMLLTSLTAQVEIKGISLGSSEKIEGETMSLIGEDYYFFTHNISDGRNCRILALPVDGENVRRVGSSELSRLKKAVENKYGVKLKFTAKNSYDEEEGWWVASDGDVRFIVTIKDHNQFEDLPYEIHFAIEDNVLSDILNQELQEKANQDI